MTQISATPSTSETIYHYPIIFHGSENSLDKDAYVVVPSALPFKAAKALCDSYTDINANLIFVKNGVVNWCYKGTVDECNNGLLETYRHHAQTEDNPITAQLSRQYGLKMVRCLRGLLSYHSRTALREDIKKALVSPDMALKIETLKKVNLNTVPDYQKTSAVEAHKFMAFQLGQTLALIEDDVEVFTKNSVAAYYPELRPYLERQSGATPEALQKFLTRFITFIENKYSKMERHEPIITNFHGVREIIDVKAEKTLPPVVVFDIDGTIMDERHRAHLRDKRDWTEYFMACGADTPIAHTVDLLRDYHAKGYEVWLVSGRADMCRKLTLDSMAQHNIPFHHMKLRGEDNKKPDYLVKPGWFANLIGLERIEVAYDDTLRVIEALKAKGVNVVDVASLSSTKTEDKTIKNKR